MGGYLDLGTIGYDLTLRKGAAWTGGMASAKGELQKLGAAMSFNQKELDRLQQDMFKTAATMRELKTTTGENSAEYKEQAAKLERLREEYGKVETATREMEKAQQRAGKSGVEAAKKVGDGFSKAGASMRQAGTQMTLGITLPIVAAGTAAVKTAIDFESAFAGVKKAIDAPKQELEALRQQILKTSQETPFSATELAGVTELGAQLGVAKENLIAFDKVALGMSLATDMDTETAASEMAKFANIMGTTQDKFTNLGSTIIKLGQVGASTESEIMAMGMRIAGAGRQIGMSEGDVLGMANALVSMGINAESGGSAISRTMSTIDKQVALSGASMKEYTQITDGNTKKAKAMMQQNASDIALWAQVSGMSVKKFTSTWKKDPAAAMEAVFKGLGKVKGEGGNLNVMLQRLGITELRQTDMMKRVSGAADLMKDSVKTGNEAWQKNTDLQRTLNERYATTESRLKKLRNQLQGAGLDVADILLPYLEQFMAKMEQLIKQFRELPEGVKQMAVGAAAVMAVLGPLLTIIGSISSGIGAVIKAGAWLVGLFGAEGAIGALFVEGGALAGIGTFFTGIASAIGAAFVGIAAAVGAPVWVVVAVVVAAVAAIGTAAYFIIKNWSAVSAFFVNLWNTVANGAKAAWAGLVSGVTSAWAAVVGAFNAGVAAVQGAWGAVTAWLAGVWGVVSSAVSAGVSAVVTAFLSFFAPLIAGAQQQLGGVLAIFSGWWTVLKNVFLGGILLLLDLFSGNFRRLKTDAAAIGQNIINAFGQMWGGVKAIWNGAVTSVTGMWGNLKSAVVAGARAIWSGVVSAFNSLKAGAIAAWNGVKSGVASAYNSIKSGVTSAFNSAKTAAVNAVNSLKAGVTAGFNATMSFIKGLPAKISGFFNALPAQLATIGGQIAQGLARGISNAWGAVTGTISRLVNSLSSGVRKLLGIQSPSRVFAEIGGHIVDGLVKGLDDNKHKVKKAAQKVVEQMNAAMQDAKSAILDFQQQGRDLGNTIARSLGNFGENSAEYMTKLAGAAKTVTADSLLKDMQTSLKAIDDWRASLAAAAAKGIPNNIVEELRAMGLDSAAQLNAINSMTAEQVAQFTSMWQQRDASGAKEGANQYVDDIAGVMKGLESKFESIGRNAMKGLGSGLKSESKAVKKHLETLMDDIIKKAKKDLGIKSPSTVFAEIGGHLIGGLVEGITSMTEKVTSTVSNVTSGLINSASNVPVLATAGVGSTVVYQYNVGDINITAEQAEKLGLTGIINDAQRLKRMG